MTATEKFLLEKPDNNLPDPGVELRTSCSAVVLVPTRPTELQIPPQLISDNSKIPLVNTSGPISNYGHCNRLNCDKAFQSTDRPILIRELWMYSQKHWLLVRNVFIIASESSVAIGRQCTI